MNKFNYHREQLTRVKHGLAGQYAPTIQVKGNDGTKTNWMDLHETSAKELVKWLTENFIKS